MSEEIVSVDSGTDTGANGSAQCEAPSSSAAPSGPSQEKGAKPPSAPPAKGCDATRPKSLGQWFGFAVSKISLVLSVLSLPPTIGLWVRDFTLYMTIVLHVFIVVLLGVLVWCHFCKHKALSRRLVVLFFVGVAFVSFHTYTRYVMENAVYYENVLDDAGMKVGVGRCSDRAVAGWYKFTFCGTHAKSNKAVNRYAENRKFSFLSRYRTLKSVMQVDACGKALADDEFNQTEYKYKYHDAGLDEIVVGRSAFDHLEKWSDLSVKHFRDHGDSPNVFCDITDDQNRELFLPGSRSADCAIQGRGVSSSFTVRRNRANGRGEVYRTTFPDFDGIAERRVAYSDDDETDMPYVSQVEYDKISRDGVRRSHTEYNGTNIIIRELGVFGCAQCKVVATSRNMNTWVRRVWSQLDGDGMPTNVLSSSMCLRDACGRVTNLVVRMGAKAGRRGWREPLVYEYEWCEGGAIKSYQCRKPDRTLQELDWSGLDWLNAVLKSGGFKPVSPCRIEFCYGKDWCDVVLYGTSGTNVLRRLRFYGSRRMEFRNADGSDYESREQNYGNEAVALEWRDATEERSDIDGITQSWECQYSSWYDRHGELIICPAEWAVCRVVQNPPQIRDPDDKGFAGRVRRTEFLDVCSNLCDKARTYPSYAYDYDRNGRPTRITTLGSAGPLSDEDHFACGSRSYRYDSAGRVTEVLLQGESAVVGSTNVVRMVLRYEGDSYELENVTLRTPGIPDRDVTEFVWLNGLLPTWDGLLIDQNGPCDATVREAGEE